MTRVIAWFSCGLTSAVTALLCLERYGHGRTRIVYCDTRSEHPDNARFLLECQEWLRHPIEVRASERYVDTWDVFERTRWLVGVRGARCTTELKKVMRNAYQQVDDLQAFGFDATELKRVERFRKNNPEVHLVTPLIDSGITKADCARIVREAGISIPAMYRLGYRNNNCLGCVKGQAGYWNKIRVDFPEVFERMAKLERDIGAAICKSEAGGKRLPLYLDELPPDHGEYAAEIDVSCGPWCGPQDNPDQLDLFGGDS